MKRSKSYIYSTIGISFVLFLLGTIGWLFINGNALSNYFKENVQLQIIMNDATRQEKAQQLSEILKKQPFIKSVNYLSKEDAYKKYVKEKGEDPLAAGLLDENPLYISIDANLRSGYVQEDSIDKIEKFILQSNIVREVVYDKNVVTSLNENLNKIAIILGIIALILFVAVVVIIDNTVRLAMFSNRMLIKTMQMVGATRWFIAKPFDQRAMTTGLISGLIAIIGLIILRYSFTNWFPEVNALTSNIQFYILCALILILGIFISLISTHRSVFKYLKMRVDKLY